MNEIRDRRYGYFLLALLLLILAFNYVDRLALGLVVQDIKVALGLSDSQIGLLGGLAFAVMYSLMGIPIARWSDSGNRVLIIALTTVLWSIGVALCGFANTFGQLVSIRVIVGIGEAGCMPPATSLITDYFPRAERPRAMSIYWQGQSLSLLIGYFAAGWLNQIFGWRWMFAGLALPGVLLGVAAWCFLKEPRRHSSSRLAPQTAKSAPPLMEVLKTLWRNSTFRQVLYGYTVMSFVGYAATSWIPAYLGRDFGLKSGELGTWLAAIYGVSCVLGTYLLGEWSTRRAACNEALQLKGAAVMMCATALLGAFVYLPTLAPNYYWALLWLGLSSATGMVTGPLLSLIQTLVPENMRATAIALLFFFANLIGMGLGPWATGALSDFLHPWAGEHSLRYALLASSPIYLWVAIHLLKAARTVTRDLAMIKHERDDVAPHDPTLEAASRIA